MGGSVAVHVAAKKAISNIHDLVVIDVVEVSFSLSLSVSVSLHLWLPRVIMGNFRTGNNKASLIQMQKILSSRAQHFPSIEKAVHNFGHLFICLL